MVHPDTALCFVSDDVGHGLFATRPIPLGTVIWVQDRFDRLLEPAELDEFPEAGRKQLARYASRDERGNLLLFWDHARFMNHSCAPTSLITGTGFSLAIRSIGPGEELTEDYAMLHLQSDEAFDCRCGSSKCRGRVGPVDVAEMAGTWSRELRLALAALGSVPQPLAGLLQPAMVRRAMEAHP